MSEPVSSSFWRRWFPAFTKAAPPPVAPPAPPPPPPAPIQHAVSQGPPPPGLRRGTIVHVSVYLPFGHDLAPVMLALSELGYFNIEARAAKHAKTQSRVSARANIPVVHCSEPQVIASIVARLPPLPRGTAPSQAPRIDVQLAPSY